MIIHAIKLLIFLTSLSLVTACSRTVPIIKEHQPIVCPSTPNPPKLVTLEYDYLLNKHNAEALLHNMALTKDYIKSLYTIINCYTVINRGEK